MVVHQPRREAAAFGGGAWSLANPISEDLKVMRPSLLPGLLAAAARNLNRGASGVRLFEIGRRYLADAERPTLGVVLAGDKRARGWQAGKAAPFDAFDAKAEALALLAAAGAPVDNLQVMGEAGDTWHPGQSGTLRLGPKTVLAAFGMLHPADRQGVRPRRPGRGGRAVSRRDPGQARGGLHAPGLRAARAAGGQARLRFHRPRRADRRRADPRGARRRQGGDHRRARVRRVRARRRAESMAIEVTLQPGEKSFTDAELKAVADKVVAAAAKLGASLRG